MNRDLVGQTLLKQFRVDAFIESGGMAAVYRVWDLKRNVSLAMKVLHADLEDEPDVLRRFQREADALKKLTHPHIVPFYGMYQAARSIFLLERFVDGFSLKDNLRKQRGKPFDINETLIYLKAICAALGYAHANDIVHCDVKPGNVMIDLSGSIYLTDFGIARYSDSTTTSFGTAGTPAYMAPEQIRGESVIPATDIYALGVLAFEMLTGQRPFHGTESNTKSNGTTRNERIRYGHLHNPPPDPRSINPSLSDDLADVIIRCLEKDSVNRFQSTQEFFDALCLAVTVSSEDVPDRIAPLQQSIVRQNVTVENSMATQNILPSPIAWRTTFFANRLLIIGSVVLGIMGVWLVGRLFGGSPNVKSDFTNTPHSTTPVSFNTLVPTSLPTTTSTAMPMVDWSGRSIVNIGCDRAGYFLSADIDLTGQYYVAYFCDATDRIEVVKSLENLSWTRFTTIRQNSREKTVGIYLTLDVEQDNSIYMSYQVWLKNAGGNRGPLVAGSFGSNGKGNPRTIEASLEIYDLRSVLDSNNVPHHFVLTKSGEIWYGSNEQLEDLVDSGVLPSNSTNLISTYYPIAVEVDSTHRPYVCYSKNGTIQCKYKSGESWESLKTPGKGLYPSLQFDKLGNLHLAFYDFTEKTLKYTFLSNVLSSWKQAETVDWAINTGLYPSLLVDLNGMVHISYYDEKNSALRYAVGKYGGWSPDQVDNSSNVGLISSLVLDSENNPAIAYYDAESQQIYFIYGSQR